MGHPYSRFIGSGSLLNSLNQARFALLFLGLGFRVQGVGVLGVGVRVGGLGFRALGPRKRFQAFP